MIYSSDCRVLKNTKGDKAFLSDQCKEIEEKQYNGKD